MSSVFAAAHGRGQTVLDARHGEKFRIVPRANRLPDPARPEADAPFTAIFHEHGAETRHDMHGKVPGLSQPALPARTRVVVISIMRVIIPPAWRSPAIPFGIRRGDHFVRLLDGTAWSVEDFMPAGPSRFDLRVLEARESV